MLTHRIAWVLFRGPIPKGTHVCHTCDNPPCCNPDHLFLGDNRINTADRHNKGRDAHGERNGNSKLSDDAVAEIRNRYGGKHGEISGLAKEYNVSPEQIRAIVRGNQRMVGITEISWQTRCDTSAKRPPRSQEVKDRIRAKLKGRKRPQEVIDKIRETRWGKRKDS